MTIDLGVTSLQTEHRYITLLDALGDCESAFCEDPASGASHLFRTDLPPSRVLTHAHNALDCYNTVR